MSKTAEQSNKQMIELRRGPINSLGLLTVLVAVITLILVGTVLKLADTVLVPLVLAWLLSQLLGPAVIFLERRHVPPGLAAGLSIILLLFIFYWLFVVMSASTTSFIKELPTYLDKLNAIVLDLIDRLSAELGDVSSADIKLEIKKQLATFTGSLMKLAGNLVSLFTIILSKMIMILIFLMFMLLGKPYGKRKIARAFPPEIASRVTKVVSSISLQISQYLIIQTVISLLTGILVGVACSLIGISSPITWGALAFFLNFIPTIGSIVASIPPIAMALLQFYPEVWPAIITLIVILAIQQIMGNVLTPKLMGDKLNLSPVVILVSLSFWGWVWGIVGALLSIVIAAAIKIVCENIEPLNPIAVMMSSGKTCDDDKTRPDKIQSNEAKGAPPAATE
ncbi:MAG: AI-2E family transporter [Spartobacteria bacterium]|nr:AI-2E family transporter [Spartobacteria bacterium]